MNPRPSLRCLSVFSRAPRTGGLAAARKAGRLHRARPAAALAGLALAWALGAGAWAASAVPPGGDQPGPDSAVAVSPGPQAGAGRAGLIGINLSMALLSFGTNDADNSFLNGRNGGLQGGAGYGVALKYGLSRDFSAKLGVDYLMAHADSSMVINGTLTSSRVDLPAAMIMLGGEYVLYPTPAMDLKLMAGYILVSIVNGNEKGAADSGVDMGAISGSTQGVQLGAGLELSLGRSFSIEADLAYNFARVGRAAFSGPPSDPGSAQVNGIVDYSGLMAKLAATIYLLP